VPGVGEVRGPHPGDLSGPRRDRHRAVQADDEGVRGQAERYETGPAHRPVRCEERGRQGCRHGQAEREDRSTDDRADRLRGERGDDQLRAAQREGAERLCGPARQPSEQQRGEQRDDEEHAASVPAARPYAVHRPVEGAP
jgi:hypothetical protein